MSSGAPFIGTARDDAPTPLVYVVGSESEARRSTGLLLKKHGYLPRPYLSADDFLADARGLAPGCVLLDFGTAGADGLRVIEQVEGQGYLPVIVTTEKVDVSTAVRAMKLGAIDVLEQPVEPDALLAALRYGFRLIERKGRAARDRREAEQRLAALSARERDVLVLLSEGKSNKEVAIALDLSVRTVEMHRATMFERLGVRTLPEAMKLSFRARADLISVKG